LLDVQLPVSSFQSCERSNFQTARKNSPDPKIFGTGPSQEEIRQLSE
jgi:hypothetical protein